MAALEDENTRKVLGYLYKLLSASRMKIAYDLKMSPNEVDSALQSLLNAELIELQSTSTRMIGQVYTPTKEALAMREIVYSAKYK